VLLDGALSPLQALVGLSGLLLEHLVHLLSRAYWPITEEIVGGPDVVV
jgi:hypothetical protein